MVVRTGVQGLGRGSGIGGGGGGGRRRLFPSRFWRWYSDHLSLPISFRDLDSKEFYHIHFLGWHNDSRDSFGGNPFISYQPFTLRDSEVALTRTTGANSSGHP